jgi:predicted RecB family endonuclease
MAIEPPAPISSGVSREGAVELCRDWMAYLGAADTVVASADVRQTCDLYSNRFVAWVDHHRGNLDPELVERAARISFTDGRRPLIFARGGVLPDAQVRADALGVALFCYVAIDGSLEGANGLGYQLRAGGLT